MFGSQKIVSATFIEIATYGIGAHKKPGLSRDAVTDRSGL